MTQDDVIRMAREAGLDIGVWEKIFDDDSVFGYDVFGVHENLEAFAKLVAAHERERLKSAAECFRMCEQKGVYCEKTKNNETN